LFEEQAVEIIVSMIEAPLGFFEVEDEGIGLDAAEFGEAQFGEAPKTFNPIDVVFTAGKLVFMMMDAVMFVTTQNEALVGLPTIGLDGGGGEHLPLDDRHQCLLGTVFDDLGEDLAPALEQADDGRLAAGSAPPFATDPARPKIGLIHLDLSGERPGLVHRQFQNPQPQQIVIMLHGVAVQSQQHARGQGWNVQRKHLHQRPHFGLGNLRVFCVTVSHSQSVVYNDSWRVF